MLQRSEICLHLQYMRRLWSGSEDHRCLQAHFYHRDRSYLSGMDNTETDISQQEDQEDAKKHKNQVKDNDNIWKEFCQDLKKRVAHKFIADWQVKQFLDSIQALQRRKVAMVMDFAENYTCRLESETQAYHNRSPYTQ